MSKFHSERRFHKAHFVLTLYNGTRTSYFWTASNLEPKRHFRQHIDRTKKDLTERPWCPTPREFSAKSSSSGHISRHYCFHSLV